MDSSRGGPLTTFIMMLPLIVVPAIAMLRPASQEGSLLSDWLSAATGNKESPQSSDGTQEDEADPFEQIFAKNDAEVSSQNAGGSHEIDAALFAEVTGESLAEQLDKQSLADTPVEVGGSTDPSMEVSARTRVLLEELKQQGMIRTLWFSPGGGQVGFVAFFLPGEGIVSYRFDAVAATHEAAVRNVMLQVQDWRGNRGQ